MLPQSNNKYMLLTSNIQIYFIIPVVHLGIKKEKRLSI